MNLLKSLRMMLTLGHGLRVGIPEAAESDDPVRLFGEWYRAAERSGLALPEAMTLATATPDGRPSARMVLLKGYGPDGFVFYTNYGSRKADELDANPRAALVFHWAVLQRQVRVEGAVERVDEATSRGYFASRGRGSRIGAWASRQSRPLARREDLEARVREMDERFAASDVPLPPFWGGYRLRPESIEFWQGRPDRLHDRLRFDRSGDGWNPVRLQP
jgi:pyridoxamine 5'-phosphate oxidase